MNDAIKKCTRCKKTYPKTEEYFYKSSNLGNPCKKCCKEKSKLQFKKRGWIKGVTKHTPDELRRRRYQRFKKKINKNISYADYKPIDVLKKFITLNKPKLNTLKKRLNKYKPKENKKPTFEEKRNHLFCKYNVPKNKRKDYLHYKNISSLNFKVRYDYDSEFNLKERLRRQIKKKMEKYPHIGDVLRADIKKNNNKLYDLLGYTMNDLKEHLEKYFSEGMTWEKFNRGEIHIDHIIPKSHFNLKNKDDIKRCWALWNLQPLWAEDNIKKSDKIIYTEQAIKISPIMSISSVFYKQEQRRKFWNEIMQRLSNTNNNS